MQDQKKILSIIIFECYYFLQLSFCEVGSVMCFQQQSHETLYFVMNVSKSLRQGSSCLTLIKHEPKHQ